MRDDLDGPLALGLTDFQPALDGFQELNERKNLFFAIVGHDLRNPLNSILLSSQMIEDEKNPAKMRRLAARITHESMEMGALLDRFLNYAAIEAGRVCAEPERFCLRALCEDLLERYRLRAQGKGVALRLEGPVAPVNVWADLRFAKEIVDNLLSNALKFSPAGTTVSLWIRPGASETRLVVLDEGPGIPAEDMARLFRPFTKLSAQPTAGEKSTGLGLFIVKHLVEAMGGRIHVKSRVGAMTAFIVDLPQPMDAHPS